jgi:pantoate--beta-alanine ligase
LSTAERQIAPRLQAVLAATAGQLAAGAAPPPALTEAKAAIEAAGFDRVEYLELRAAEDLSPLAALDRPARLLAAAWLGDTRLIDNLEVGQVKAAPSS